MRLKASKNETQGNALGVKTKIEAG